METKDTRRRRKLELLIAGTPGGMDAIATAAQINPAYLSQIVKGVLLPPKKDGSRSPRALGDAAAEKIEDAYHLGRGWFDSNLPLPGATGVAEPTPSYASWPFTALTQKQWAALGPQSRAMIEALALQLLTAQDNNTSNTIGATTHTKQAAPPTRAYAAR